MCHVDVTGVHLISIPAPPRGATGRGRGKPYLFSYFNSRPSARGDTPTPRRTSAPCRHFNSRPSARGDGEVEKRLASEIISIHAPPRGATVVHHAQKAVVLFQFTPLREGRRITFLSPRQAVRFQFTPLREGRQISEFSFHLFPYFNSRPSVRGDRTGSIIWTR